MSTAADKVHLCREKNGMMTIMYILNFNNSVILFLPVYILNFYKIVLHYFNMYTDNIYNKLY